MSKKTKFKRKKNHKALLAKHAPKPMPYERRNPVRIKLNHDK